MNLTTIPFIVLASYIGGELFKVIVKNKTGLNRLISLIPSLLGCLLAVVIYLDEPSILGTSNIYVAMEIGIISGASATGTNQMIKQIFMKNTNNNEEK